MELPHGVFVLDDLVRELHTIANYHDGDKFAVRNGQLKISKSGFLQGLKRTFQNIFVGGHNRYDVTQHFEQIANSIGMLSHDEKRQHASLLLQSKHVISTIQDAYRPADCLEKRTVSDTLSNIYARVRNATENLELATRNYQKSDLAYYNGEPESILHWHGDLPPGAPQNISSDEIKDLLQSSQRALVGKAKEVAIKTFAYITAFFAGTPLILLTTAKWLIWNPIEYLCKGEVTTKNPLEWFLDQTSLLINKYASNADTLIKMRRLSNWFFQELKQMDQITNKVVDDFCEFSIPLLTTDCSRFAITFDSIEEFVELVQQYDPEGTTREAITQRFGNLFEAGTPVSLNNIGRQNVNPEQNEISYRNFKKIVQKAQQAENPTIFLPSKIEDIRIGFSRFR